MTAQPLVSILINNHNYGRFVAEAIQSALGQSYPKTELIVVDDGSTDASCQVIRSYVRRYPNRVRAIYQENGGQASAMNRGFQACRGDIVCFLDSDDYWFGEKVAKVVQLHRDHDVVQHNLLQNGQRYRLLVNTGDLQRFLREFGLIRSCVPTSAISFSRPLLEMIMPLPEEELRMCADAYLRCAAVYHAQPASLDECLGVYRLHGNNGWQDNLRLTRPNIARDIVRLLNNDLQAKGLQSIPECENAGELAFLHSVDIEPASRYLLYGAGDLGTRMAARVESQGGVVIGFCDDNSSTWGASVMGHPVHSPIQALEARNRFDKVVISCTLVEDVYEKLASRGLSCPADILVPIDLQGHIAGSATPPSPCYAYCPVCNRDVTEWKPFTRRVGEGIYRTEPEGRLCPHCGSFERTRHFWMYIEKTGTLAARPRMLHVAPERGLSDKLRAVLGRNYVSVDLSMQSADVKADITSLPFLDDSFELIYCSNVLEHVQDDHAAMAQLLRVLAPGGLAYLQVPVNGEVTKEDPSVVDPAERAQLFGQADHVRAYGRDFAARLQSVGFAVSPQVMPDSLAASSAQLTATNAHKKELIHLCHKGTARGGAARPFCPWRDTHAEDMSSATRMAG